MKKKEKERKNAFESAVKESMEEINKIMIQLRKTHVQMEVESLDSAWLKYLLQDTCQDLFLIITKFDLLVKKPNE